LATEIRSYDVHGVELTHDGEFCSFDAFLTPESGGLFAICLGLSDLHASDDHAMLRHGFIIYDALYRWLKCRRGEKHLWFPNTSKQAAAS
jgi:hypothetical protein